MKNKKTCIDILGLDRCTGCFACQTACPQGAIRLDLDAEGFYRPVVNRDTCIHCGFCRQRCPVLVYDAGQRPEAKWREPRTFAAWSTDEPLRLASSSGGIFSELARPVIEAGGVVAGCVWGADWTPHHVLARTWTDVEKMRGSKYVPSQVGDVYKDVVDHLRATSKPVLFSGTPCQVAAMDLALNREQRKRVLLVDLICHGLPSLRVFHSYLSGLFQGNTLISYTFREKTFEWQSVLAESADQRRHHLPASRDNFFAGFAAHHLYLMIACHQCAFTCVPRAGDITLGDFWGCPKQWHDPRGVSVVLANTPSGLSTIEALERVGRIVLKPTEFAVAAKENPRLVTGVYTISTNRRPFLNGIIAGKNFGAMQSKYFPKGIPRWLSWWNRFKGSDAKIKFTADTVLRLLRKLGNKAPNDIL